MDVFGGEKMQCQMATVAPSGQVENYLLLMK